MPGLTRNIETKTYMRQDSDAVPIGSATPDTQATTNTVHAEARRQHGEPPGHVTVDRRNNVDRRGSFWRSLLYGNLRPRRRGSRREQDAHLFWFDWHEPRILYLALGILLLSCTDALFTLNLINAGAAEANAIMDAMLQIGMDRFVIGKILITSFSVLILVVAARRTLLGSLNVEHILQTVFSGYLLLIAYELYMFWFVFELSIAPAWLHEIITR